MTHRTRYVLAVSFFLIATLPVLLLGAWIERTTTRQEIATVAEKHLLVARNLTEALNRHVVEARATFEFYVANHANESAIAGVPLLAERIGFRHFRIVDGEGRTMSALHVTDHAPPQVRPSLFEMLRQLLPATRTRFAPVALDGKGRPTIFLLRSLEDGRVALGALSTEYVSRLQQTVAFGRGGHAAVVDQVGSVIAHPLPEWEKEVRSLAALAPVERMRRGGSGVMTFHSPASGREMIAGYTSVLEAGWGVMVPQPLSELTERAGEVRLAALTVIVGGLGAAALLSWVIAGLLLRPVVAVMQAAGRIARGDVEARAVLPRRLVPKEFQQLGDAFNAMARRIGDQQRELALRAEKERLQTLSVIASNIPGLIFRRAQDRSGIPKFELVSAGAKDGFDLDIETLQAEPGRFESFILPEDRAGLEQSFAVSGSTLERQVHEFRIRGRDGGIRWGRAVSHPHRMRDGTVVWDGIVFDITDHRNTEAELRLAMDEAEQANQAKTEFLANMSHELRTPLNAIIGFSEMMKLRLFGELQDRYATYAADINASAQYLLSLINDLLDLSKVESGNWELDEQIVPVSETIRHTCGLLEDDFRRRGLDLRVQVAPQLPELFADQRMVQQMLINILSNSMKFTPPGGTVSVGADVVGDGGIEIAVEDTGIGIAEEDMERVILPFSQARSEHQGTGLGLALVKSFIELHDGQLCLESELGVGTTVRLGFPQERVVRLAA